MNPEEELLTDWHQCCLHMLRNEWKEAAEIVRDYVLILSAHPDKASQPIEQAARHMLREGKPGVCRSFEVFKALLRGVVEASNEGRIVDIGFRFN